MSMGDGAGGMMEANESEPSADDSLDVGGLGKGGITKSQRIQNMKAQAKQMQGEDSGVIALEHKMLEHIQSILTSIAEKGNLVSFKGPLESLLKQIVKATRAEEN